MPRRQYSFLLVIGVVLLAGCLLFTGSAQTPSGRPDVFAVQVDRPGAAISPEMFGVFFEDINFAADGGLYPERVKNRSFEFTEPLNAWRKVEREGAEGELIVRTESPLNESNPHYLRIRIHAPGAGFGIVNAGFRGMGVEEGAEYVLSAYVRGGGAAPKTLQAELTDEGGRQLSSAKLTSFGGQWKKYEATLRPSATSPRARLTVLANEPGEIDVDMISVYPKETWKNRPNGLRSDLVKLLADMKPGFIRFPGGCIVEGRRLELRYDWKKTVGDVSERRLIVNRWNDEFNHKLTPDYFQSFGLGFFEYFQLAEDIGASPLPIVNCGMACQFNSSETAALDKLDPFIQDAMDLIAFANGSMQSRWGRLRARMGHPAPFNLKRIGIGNEQWGPRYIERYKRFAAVLKKAHPEIALIASAGPSASGKQFEYLWSSLRDLKADIIDEHYYMAPKWFLSNAGRYDRYDRRGPKVFAGEYAAQTSGVARPDNRNNWEAALAEAAFITGLERNADVVTLASYAPLFAHVDAWQWTPNMIWFDNLRSFGTPNYYVQKLYSTNLGTHVLPVTMNGSTDNSQQELYSSASLDRKSGEVILKIVNAGKEVRAARVDFSGIASLKGSAKQIVLVSGDLKAENSLDQSMRIAPVEKIITAAGRSLQVKLEPYSMTVLRTAYLQ
jgi:alpha-L-arabinofuranosidase